MKKVIIISADNFGDISINLKIEDTIYKLEDALLKDFNNQVCPSEFSRTIVVDDTCDLSKAREPIPPKQHFVEGGFLSFPKEINSEKRGGFPKEINSEKSGQKIEFNFENPVPRKFLETKPLKEEVLKLKPGESIQIELDF